MNMSDKFWCSKCKATVDEPHFCQPPRPRERNPEAVCGNCPYRHVAEKECRRYPPPPEYGYPAAWETDWCGEHPSFFKEQE